ncbi:DUF1289 domain-containing protein [Aliidiomarina halalkaliphila]|uniref:DUF1289 domain-containing protein n=1 Tax=Aliidiomarina halalkaliphila TaxID=2593535 RepID=A0A552X3E6_9GAMM|nr:DUF1289 domain-containing protein [Aliidiomarina halalkaliphila]TRW49542.1 DUF1289 domain-containing protein [Aliidiomarina halalkaliphila]
MATNQLEMFELPNPCIGVCESGPRGYCLGCLRSREERFNWHDKPEAERSRILRLLADRQKRKEAFLRQQAKQEREESQGPSQLDLL